MLKHIRKLGGADVAFNRAPFALDRTVSAEEGTG